MRTGSTPFDKRFVARAQTFSRIASVTIMLVGIVVLTGWALGIGELTVLAGPVNMKPNAAVCFVLAGTSVLLLHFFPGNRLAQIAGQVCGGLVAVIGGATLSEHLFGWNLDIDQLLFSEAPGSAATVSPGRMGPPASTSFALAGTALVLLHASRNIAVAQLLALPIIGWGLFAVGGYVYNAEGAYNIARLTGIAFPTAVGLVLLGAGLLTARADDGAVMVLGADTAGGQLARRFIVAAVSVPFLMLGWMRLLTEHADEHQSVGIVLAVLATAVFFVIIVWHGAVRLNQEERDRLYVEEELTRANKLKDDFLATVSHELRTPLNAILGWSTMLRRGALEPAKVSRAVAIIERNARMQAQLIEDLLEVSRIVSGKLRLELDTVSIPSIVQAAADTVRPAAAAKGVRLSIAEDGSPLYVSGDSGRLQQMVWNLLSNAVKFTSRGGSVGIEIKRAAHDVLIEVSDTGEGIDSDFLPFVFERFQQADSKSTRRHGGLGLGLAITRHLVEMHGGSIAADSAGPGKGATFTIRLPLTEPPAPVARPVPPSTDNALLRGLRILAVDDEEDAREMLQGVLEQYGAEVVTAHSAGKALDILVEWRPDVALCDIGMPGVDGYGLIRRMRALGPEAGGNTLAIALTGYVRIEERVRALEAGFQMFVPKPVIPEELVSMIASLATSHLLRETESMA